MANTALLCNSCVGLGHIQIEMPLTKCRTCDGKGSVDVGIDERLDYLYRWEKLTLACDLLADLSRYGEPRGIADLTLMDTGELHETIKELDSAVESAKKRWDERNGVVR